MCRSGVGGGGQIRYACEKGELSTRSGAQLTWCFQLLYPFVVLPTVSKRDSSPAAASNSIIIIVEPQFGHYSTAYADLFTRPFQSTRSVSFQILHVLKRAGVKRHPLLNLNFCSEPLSHVVIHLHFGWRYPTSELGWHWYCTSSWWPIRRLDIPNTRLF